MSYFGKPRVSVLRKAMKSVAIPLKSWESCMSYTVSFFLFLPCFPLKGRPLREQQEVAAAVIQRCYRKYKQVSQLVNASYPHSILTGMESPVRCLAESTASDAWPKDWLWVTLVKDWRKMFQKRGKKRKNKQKIVCNYCHKIIFVRTVDLLVVSLPAVLVWYRGSYLGLKWDSMWVILPIRSLVIKELEEVWYGDGRR